MRIWVRSVNSFLNKFFETNRSGFFKQRGVFMIKNHHQNNKFITLGES